MDSTIIVALIAALPSLITIVYTIVRDHKNTVKSAVGFLLLRNLEHECNKLIAQGYMYRHQLKLIEEMYEIYHKIGNGYADAIMAQCKKLPLKDD